MAYDPSKTLAEIQDQIIKCRRLADLMTDLDTADRLRELADEIECAPGKQTGTSVVR
jgi:hypothetical protein